LIRANTPVKKQILVYGLLGGLLITVLKLVEYRFLVVEHSIEIYGGLIALLFAGVGIWLGLKLTGPKDRHQITTAVRPWIIERKMLSAEGATLDRISKQKVSGPLGLNFIRGFDPRPYGRGY